MTANQDLAGLPEHVQQALHEIREALRVQGVGSHGPQFAEITSYCARLRKMVRERSQEMLRLVHESGELKARAERAEAELAAMKRRIAEAPVREVLLDSRDIEFLDVPDNWPEGTRVALLPVGGEV